MRIPKKTALPAFLALLAVAAAGDAPKPVAPFETEGGFAGRGTIDSAVLAALTRRGITPANRCSDEVFVRRVYLDVIGRLPEPADVLHFVGDKRPDKRALLIDALLARDEFAEHFAMKWCDVLRVKAEFPINLWPNAAQAYHRWILDALKKNQPVDRFARELLTSSGSNFRAAPVNFFRAVPSREPAALAQAVALTFLGTRIEGWPEPRRAGLAAFFSRVAYKRTKEWKEEIVTTKPATGPIEAVFPDGSKVRISPDDDPRRVFADWLLAPRNPWFARNIVNRAWAWLMGRGIIHEPDDVRPENPPSNAPLLALLEEELVSSGYDLRHLLRLILDSATYQQSAIPRSDHAEAEALFAHCIVRRLDAELIVDALCQITGTGEAHSSTTPEPFTFVPEEVRTVGLADGSITSPLLEMFGRPSRDTGLVSERSNNPTEAQRLHLLNSSDVLQRIKTGFMLGKIVAGGVRGRPREAIDQIYLRVLARSPTPDEVAAVERHLRSPGVAPFEAAQDLVWALINSKEFLYRH